MAYDADMFLSFAVRCLIVEHSILKYWLIYFACIMHYSCWRRVSSKSHKRVVVEGRT